MQIDTTRYRNLARLFLNHKRNYLIGLSPTGYSRHQMIQRKLTSFSDYFAQSANLYEDNENKQNHIFKDGSLKTRHNTNINIPSIIMKTDKKSYLSGSLQYSFKEAGLAYRNDWINANAYLNIGDAKVKGEAEFSLWKDKKFDPKIKAKLDADIALASANVNAFIGNKNINANVNVRGAVGALYADVECVLSKDEQVFEAGIGACALKGEASIAFNLFGVKITLTGQGSIGSAEANISYHHKNKEWEFGSKLGFIAGLGFKIRVNY